MTPADYLKQATFYTDDEHYALVKLPASAITAAAGVIAEVGAPFLALVVDKDEVTLVLPPEAVEDFAGRLQGHTVSEVTCRLLTIDVVLPPDLVGFMAAVSTALANAGVTVFPFAAYSRDHILVPQDQFDVALKALQELQKQP